MWQNESTGALVEPKGIDVAQDNTRSYSIWHKASDEPSNPGTVQKHLSGSVSGKLAGILTN